MRTLPSRMADLVARGCAPRGTRRRDHGSVLVETAIAIPVLISLAAALVWVLTLGTSALALQEAARQVARDLARGVDVSSAVAAAETALPGAEVSVTEVDGSVVVEAAQQVGAPVPVLSGIRVPLSQRVTIAREWS